MFTRAQARKARKDFVAAIALEVPAAERPVLTPAGQVFTGRPTAARTTGAPIERRARAPAVEGLPQNPAKSPAAVQHVFTSAISRSQATKVKGNLGAVNGNREMQLQTVIPVSVENTAVAYDSMREGLSSGHPGGINERQSSIVIFKLPSYRAFLAALRGFSNENRITAAANDKHVSLSLSKIVVLKLRKELLRRFNSNSLYSTRKTRRENALSRMSSGTGEVAEPGLAMKQISNGVRGNSAQRSHGNSTRLSGAVPQVDQQEPSIEASAVDTLPFGYPSNSAYEQPPAKESGLRPTIKKRAKKTFRWTARAGVKNHCSAQTPVNSITQLVKAPLAQVLALNDSPNTPREVSTRSDPVERIEPREETEFIGEPDATVSISKAIKRSTRKGIPLSEITRHKTRNDGVTKKSSVTSKASSRKNYKSAPKRRKRKIYPYDKKRTKKTTQKEVNEKLRENLHFSDFKFRKGSGHRHLGQSECFHSAVGLIKENQRILTVSQASAEPYNRQTFDPFPSPEQIANSAKNYTELCEKFGYENVNYELSEEGKRKKAEELKLYDPLHKVQAGSVDERRAKSGQLGSSATLISAHEPEEMRIIPHFSERNANQVSLSFVNLRSPIRAVASPNRRVRNSPAPAHTRPAKGM